MINEHIAKIKKLLDEEKYSEAVELCNDPDYSENALVQSLKTIALMRDCRVQEALDSVTLALSRGYNAELEDKRILLISILNGPEQALIECDKEENKEKRIIQLRKATILKDLRRLDEALDICNRPGYTEGIFGPRFIDMKRRINGLKKNSNNNIEVSKLLTKIYVEKVTKEELENANIDEWNKELLLLAYYEKKNKSTGLQIIKELKKKYANQHAKIKVLNNFYTKFSSKKSKLCDIGHYAELLGCKVNFEYALELNKDTETKETEVKTEIIKEENKPNNKKEDKEKKQRKMVGSTGTVVNSRYSNNNSNSNTSVDTPSKKDNQVILIKDYFRTEVDEVRKYLYKSMADDSSRKSATNAYDLFENMVNKSVEDKATLTRFRNLLEKMLTVTKIEIDLVDKKIKKL